jgi:hypothetical protein
MKQSILRLMVASSLLLPVLFLVSACGNSGGFPPLADLKAVTESKPIPGDEIATDPAAESHYNASVEGWGDRVYSAGVRLCRFFKDTDMPGVDFCPAKQ